MVQIIMQIEDFHHKSEKNRKINLEKCKFFWLSKDPSYRQKI